METVMLITKEGKSYIVRDTSKDFHCEFGFIKAQDLSSKPGTIVKTNKDKELTLIEPSFIDLYRKIKRAPQIIPEKDIGLIISKTGIGKNSKVLDAGTGSAALALMLANICKEVISYEIREDFFSICQKNIEKLQIKNLNILNKDITQGIDQTNLDLITLDLPKPWDVVPHLTTALKPGGFVVSYSPTIPQVMDFVQRALIEKHLAYLETIEILERQWEINDRKVRPKSQQIGHSGFLTFFRRI